MEHSGVEGSRGGAGVSPLHNEASPARRLAVVNKEVRQPAELPREPPPEVDVATHWVEAAAVRYSRFWEVPLFFTGGGGGGGGGGLRLDKRWAGPRMMQYMYVGICLCMFIYMVYIMSLYYCQN